jgi:hypothetical protein
VRHRHCFYRSTSLSLSDSGGIERLEKEGARKDLWKNTYLYIKNKNKGERERGRESCYIQVVAIISISKYHIGLLGLLIRSPSSLTISAGISIGENLKVTRIS